MTLEANIQQGRNIMERITERFLIDKLDSTVLYQAMVKIQQNTNLLKLVRKFFI